MINTLRKEVGDDGAIKTTGAVDDVGGLFDGGDGVWCSRNLGIKPGFFDAVFRHGLAVKFVFTLEDGAVFGLKVDVAGLKSDGNGGTFEVNTKKVFEVRLNLTEVVVIFFQKTVVDTVAEIAIPAVGEVK